MTEIHIFRADPTWPLWAQRDAHEGGSKRGEHETLVLAAAQWILWSGQSFYKHLLFPGEAKDRWGWNPGKLYDGSRDRDVFSLRRWHFWRDGFRAAAEGTDLMVDEKGAGREVMEVSRRAAEIMDALEKNMTF